MTDYFDTKIEFLKGVGPQKSALLNKELGIFDFGDLIKHYPFRYEDRSQFYKVSEVNDKLPYIQIKGTIKSTEIVGPPRKKRLVAQFADDTGVIELVWFKGVQWIQKSLKLGVTYVVFGKANIYGRKLSIAHPELEVLTKHHEITQFLQPVYPTTERLRTKYLDSKGLSKLQKTLVTIGQSHISETLPHTIIDKYRLMSKKEAIVNIHFPENHEQLEKAQFRLKFEELFYIQLNLLKLKLTRIEKFKGQVLDQSQLVTAFYEKHIPFDLTNAQKRVIKEIYKDMRSGNQMNRLLQGDVGSGKTMVAFICMLLSIGSNTQAALVAPTQILAEQHYKGLQEYAKKLGLTIALLTGATKKSERKIIFQMLSQGDIHILIGTHALFEDNVTFQNLSLAVIDEQHRFGVAQRAKLWQKNKEAYPHILVMTATPIPRTLAMTLYGDLDVSIIDELPPGRKPVETLHRYEEKRLKIFGFIKEQITEGRQVYIVYPLIEESETLDYNNLMEGYESICRAFPSTPVSILHGKMTPDAKDFEMQRFVKAETKIMVATTVIEVGVNVPNASVMVIENAERFGLSQLHQLRGRVGRGADQSYCILVTGYKLSKEGRQRIDTMVRTNNGFEIADVDLKLRGPGDLSGTQQSGLLDLSIADLSRDVKILSLARDTAIEWLDQDPELGNSDSSILVSQLQKMKRQLVNWSKVS